MHEIKFMVWDLDHKKMSGPYLERVVGGMIPMVIWDGKNYRMNTNLLKPYEISRVDLLPFTGIKDKTGKEIYAGHIVSYKIGSIKVNALVEWSTDSAAWVKDGQRLSTYQKTTEVIGTIYEDLNLLKK